MLVAVSGQTKASEAKVESFPESGLGLGGISGVA